MKKLMKTLFLGALVLSCVSLHAMELNKDVLTQVAKFADVDTLMNMSLASKESKAGVDQFKDYYFKDVNFPLGDLGKSDVFIDAVNKGDLSVIENLERYLVDAKIVFIKAARNGELSVMEWLLIKGGIDVYTLFSALMAAAGSGCLKSLKWLNINCGTYLDVYKKNKVIDSAYQAGQNDAANWIIKNM